MADSPTSSPQFAYPLDVYTNTSYTGTVIIVCL